MKIWIIIMTLIAHAGVAQEIDIDSCGLDDFSILNDFESEYFNHALANQSRDQGFDFKGKKVAFTCGNWGKEQITKKEYFNRWGREYFEKDSNVSSILLVLSDEEKRESGGFDVIIVSWSKVMIDEKTRRKLIRKTASNNL